MIDQVLNWGRQNYTGSNVRDTTGYFDPAEVEKWRKELRQRWIDRKKTGDKNIDGDTRTGYEVVLSSGEAVGLTKVGGNGFVVYYRKGAMYYA